MYSVMTCADTKFYSMACILAKNIRLYPDCQLFLYDLGLRESERTYLESLGVTIEYTDFSNDTFTMNSKGNIRTTHKINCIRHFLNKYKKSIVILDADAMLVDNCIAEIFPEENDIVVTYRCDRERKEHILINGKINAGVMGFGKNIGNNFFDKWEATCQDLEQTDQSALSMLLDDILTVNNIDSYQHYMSYNVRILDGNIYNDVTCRIGKIFHFKSAGRRLNKYLTIILFSFLQRNFPNTISDMIRFNRKNKIFIWKK